MILADKYFITEPVVALIAYATLYNNRRISSLIDESCGTNKLQYVKTVAILLYKLYFYNSKYIEINDILIWGVNMDYFAFVNTLD